MHIHTLIIGAGLSGLNMAVQLQQKCPQRPFLIIEARERLGGTWDLFRYPNIRSDSDMYSYGFSFQTWQKSQAFASGKMLYDYLYQTADDYQLFDKIKFNHHVQHLNWDSTQKQWQIQIEHQQQILHFTANFVIIATGYYDYQKPYIPDFQGQNIFQGKITHAQHWQPDTAECKNLKNQSIIVIGSGATAISLVPALADLGAKVNMIQRSPSYIIALPQNDIFSRFSQKYLPKKIAQPILKQRSILFQHATVLIARQKPELFKTLLKYHQKKILSSNIDLKHFSPNYKPWRQRVCVDVDGHFFQHLNQGNIQIYTDQIDYFTETGVQLKSNTHLKADRIILATGLNIQLFGGATLSIDHKQIEIKNHLMYRGILINNIPNLAWLAGYPHLSWSLRIELVADYVCRLFAEMQKRDATVVYAERGDAEAYPISTLGSALNSGYVKRAEHLLPRQGKPRLWRGYASYYAEKWSLKRAKFDDDYLTFE